MAAGTGRLDGLTTNSRAMAVVDRAEAVTDWLKRWGSPVSSLLVRVVLFRVFFYSGLVKISDWESTLDLFQTEYAVPVIPILMAALVATAAELGAATCILAGFATRIAALPLLGIACVIQFVLGAADPVYDRLEHFLWIVLLVGLVVNGPGKLSLDYFVKLFLHRRSLSADAITR